VTSTGKTGTSSGSMNAACPTSKFIQFMSTFLAKVFPEEDIFSRYLFILSWCLTFQCVDFCRDPESNFGGAMKALLNDVPIRAAQVCLYLSHSRSCFH
jgi:hypothetical protein